MSLENDLGVKGSNFHIFFFVSGKPELTNGLPEAEAVRHHFSDFLSFGTLQYEHFHKAKFC